MHVEMAARVKSNTNKSIEVLRPVVQVNQTYPGGARIVG
jgi:hypothetical protein